MDGAATAAPVLGADVLGFHTSPPSSAASLLVWDALPLVGNPSLWFGVCPFFGVGCSRASSLPPGFWSHRAASWGYWLGVVRSSSM